MNKPTKKIKTHLTARIDRNLRRALETEAINRKVSLSWLVERVLETGLPIYSRRAQ